MILPKNTADLPDDIKSISSMIEGMFDEVYLVGGVIRDVILRKSTQDLDFATPSSTNTIIKVLSTNNFLSVHKEGIEFGTVSAHFGNYDIQITTYRSEKYALGSRKPKVNALIDIESDLSRRDFTINAMAISQHGLIDPYNGVDDIQKSIIRAVGDPDIKFKEDPLRILRAFRFVSSLGFNIEDNTLKSAIAYKNNLQIISSERIGEELKKLIAGDYWADALNEMSDAGVLNSVIKAFDFTFEVNPDDVSHEFDKYTVTELEALDIVERWLYVIRILIYAEHAAGVTSSDSEALAESLLIKSQVEKQIRAEIIKLLKSATNPDNSNTTLAEQIESAQRQMTILKSANDPRYMIEEAKYYMLCGRVNLQEMQYGLARRNYKKAIEVTEQNFSFILGFQDEEKKKIKLRGLASYYNRRLEYYIASIILDEKLYSKFSSTDKLSLWLQKEIKPAHINKETLRELIDRALAYVYRKDVHGLTLESYEAFLKKPNIMLDDESISRYHSQHIESRIRNPNIAPSEKAKLYLQKAKYASAGRDKSEYGLEYFDPYIDYLFNKMLSQKNLTKYWGIYAEFEVAAIEYQRVASRERRPWIGSRKYHLTSASSLAHALTLAESIDQKLKIVEHIIGDYEHAGHGFEKNVQRFRVYQEWFLFVEKLLSVPYSEDVARELHLMLHAAKSRNYVDVDEDYLATKRKDIVQKRQLLQESYTLISNIISKGLSKEQIENKVLKSIEELYDAELIDPNHAFTLFKNYISSDENQHITIDNLEIIDREFADKEINVLREYLTGESETVEYKSSWKFDKNRYKYTEEVIENKDLRWEVIKNIAGMANKRGGTLLIGVEDDGTVCGLEDTDFLLFEEKNHLKIADMIDREIRNEIGNKLGLDVLAAISMDAIKYENKTVIRIKVPVSKPQSPVIYKEDGHETYYVRSGKSTNDAGMRALLAR